MFVIILLVPNSNFSGMIYRLFLDGKTTLGIGRTLTKQGIPSLAGHAKRSKTTIHSILTNEKYKGDALLQKRFTVDFLHKKMNQKRRRSATILCAR